MLHVTHGDLFGSDDPVIVCPTNSVGVMGAGLAKAFANRYPDLRAAYAEACRQGMHDAAHPLLWQGPGRLVACVATKRHWRDASHLDDVRIGAQALKAILVQHGWTRVSLPALGCGLGGLNWADVHQVLADVFADDAVHATVYLT